MGAEYFWRKQWLQRESGGWISADSEVILKTASRGKSASLKDNTDPSVQFGELGVAAKCLKNRHSKVSSSNKVSIV